jgi:hypothetical protein
VRRPDTAIEGGCLLGIVEQVITFLDDDYEVALAAGDDPETEQFIRALAATGRTVQLQLALQ